MNTPETQLPPEITNAHIGEVIRLTQLAYRMGISEVAQGNTDPALKRSLANARQQIKTAQQLQGK